jgi:hypothetical protein
MYLSPENPPRFISLENLAPLVFAGSLLRWIFWWKQHRHGTSLLASMAWMGKEELVEADLDGYKAACLNELETLAAGDSLCGRPTLRGEGKVEGGPQLQVLSEDGDWKARWKGQKNCCHMSACFRMLFNCHCPLYTIPDAKRK